jgi:hypothetical protein
MIMDGLLLFSSAQNLTTGTIASTNVIDLLNARNMGVGDDPALKIACFITTAFTTTDSGTLTIQAQGSTDNSTYTVYAESRAYAAAELVVNAKLFPIDWPANGLWNSLGNDPQPRYLRLAYVMGSLHFTPGAVTSALVLDRQDSINYPAGIYITN